MARLKIGIAPIFGCIRELINVKNAFVNAILNVSIYIGQPESFAKAGF